MKIAVAVALFLLASPQPAVQTGKVRNSLRSSNPQLTTQSEEPTDKSVLENGIVALVPINKRGKLDLVWGLTAEAYPTFWFYNPYSERFPTTFLLLDQTKHLVSKIPALLPGRPGVIGVHLPSTAPPLEIGKNYHWYFNIADHGSGTGGHVDGWITRRKPNASLEKKLGRATTPKERAALLAPAGFWYDALTASAETRRTEPQNPAWGQLLRAIGLEALASKPIVSTPSLGR